MEMLCRVQGDPEAKGGEVGGDGLSGSRNVTSVYDMVARNA